MRRFIHAHRMPLPAEIPRTGFPPVRWELAGVTVSSAAVKIHNDATQSTHNSHSQNARLVSSRLSLKKCGVKYRYSRNNRTPLSTTAVPASAANEKLPVSSAEM